LAFFNVGAAAVDVVWIGASAGGLFVTYTTLPGHFGDYQVIGFEHLGQSDEEAVRSRGTSTLLLVARSVDDEWWDCSEAKG